jgi:hypothetical protein
VRQLASRIALAFVVAMLSSLPCAGAATHGRLITDAKYSIKFYVPANWKHCVVTTSDSGSAKIVVQDESGNSIVGVVAVLVVAGRSANASAIAAGLLSSSSGVKVLGSSVESFSFGRAEQLRYSLVESGVRVFGIAESFYQHKHTCIVAFYSVTSSANVAARSVVMNSWGA